MLTDPFYDPAPAYGEKYTGVIEIEPEVGTDTVSLLITIRDILLSAEWFYVASEHSTGEVATLTTNMPVVSVPTAPRPLVPNWIGCSTPLNPVWVIAVFDDMSYVMYNPYTEVKPIGCADRIFWPAGTNLTESSENLAAAITANSSYFVNYTGLSADGHWLNFHVESKAPAWENDTKRFILGGAGSSFTSGGYYTLRSPTTDEDGFLEAKLQCVALWGLIGIQTSGGLGDPTPFISVRGSGSSDGHYSQAIYPFGDFWMCASKWQFAIWCDRTGRTASAMVASLPKPDRGHPGGANAALVYGSESYTWLGLPTPPQKVVRQLHWEDSYATGLGAALHDVGWRTQTPSNTHWQNPTLLHRGLRTLPLKSVNSMPLVTSAYAMVSGDPNAVDEVRIGGRLWDMIVATDFSLNTGLIDQEGEALFDNAHWMKLATASVANDLTSSLWVKVEKGA